MKLQMRIEIAARLGKYILDDNPAWQEVKIKASLANPWFTPEFIQLAAENIAMNYLEKEKLIEWVSGYNCEPGQSKKIGIVMAGNIPMVGFHDLLCVFISGHKALVKTSSKDDLLIKHLVRQLAETDSEINELIMFSEMLKGCNAYIATGSNNSARYFEYYFGKWPNIIRKNRTSVAFIAGDETSEELEKLADDVHFYFGMGCRNVTKLFVPENYDFLPLLNAFRKYTHFKDHNKYKNNYDYNLALHILNHKFYMTNESVLLFEDNSVFSPISQVNYEFYKDKKSLAEALKNNESVQCITGHDFIPFGQTQSPSLTDYADGVDTMKFLEEM